ncbi:PAS domain S-box protein [Natronolimnohabitans sp. A-GB9]|uniref:PAS domain S-box protein n=1 Tax=Natronolimnohabitans sp. A-GB9 TaxID=3069757 RepID=UPI0027B7BADF|nr:PAS domain S-box protein [Natronolimnohabitans sp. A-GB9]MDQ2051220.1 PAS domain S-box protein [Natronolimnohabitans sp. A-GB9]
MSERAGATDGSFWADSDEGRALERYQTLVNAIDDGLYQLDADGRFVAVNDGLLEATGYSREQVIGDHASVLFEASDVKRIEREIEARRSSDHDDAFELVVNLQTATDERLPVELRGTLLVDDGEFQGTVGVTRDVSDDGQDNRDDDRLALESPEPVTTVLDEADVGVFVLDDAFDIAWVDETAAEYFGIDRDDVVGRDKRAVIEETIRNRVAEGERFAETVLAAYDDNTYVEQFECRVTPDDGRTERWLEHRSKPIESGRYAGGRVELYYDITEQRRRTTQLRRLNEAVGEWLEESSREAVAERASDHLRTVLNMEINGIFFHEPASDELRPVSWSERAEALFDELPTFAAGEGVAWRVFETGEPAVYDDVSTAPDVYNAETPARNEIVLPIGEYGVVIVGSERQDEFDDTDLMLAEVAASSLEATIDRIHHERRLARERDLTDRILDATPVGTFVLDVDGNVVRMNDRARDLLEIEDPETYAPSDRPTYDASGNRLSVDDHPFATALESGERVFDRVVQVELPSGERRWLSVNAVPITDEDGAVERVVTTGEDVTELKERERKLESELQEVFGRISDAVYALDDGYRFTYLNERAASLFAVDEAELRGQRLGEAFQETDEIERVRETIDAAMERQEPTQLEHYSELLECWIEATIYPSESGVSVYFRDVTERKEIEQALHERTETFRQVAENLDQVLWMSDTDKDEMVYVNAGYEEIWGRSRESLYEDPTSFLEAIHPEDRERVATALPDQRRGEYDEKYRIVRPDGSVRWVHDRAVPIRDDDGEIYRIVGIADDVTDRREAERELQEAKSQLEAAIAAGAVGTWEWHVPDDRFIAGETFAETFGVEPDAAREGVSLEQFVTSVHEDDRERVAAEIDDALERCGEYEEEYRVRDADGNLRWVLARGTVDCDETGTPITFPGTVVDITDRKRAERQLQQTTEELETLFDVLPVGVVVANEDGSIRRANDVAREIWGGDVFDADSVADYEQYTARWADTGEPVAPEEWTMAAVLDGEAVTDPNVYEIETFDGRQRIIMEHGMPVRDENGSVRRAVVTLTDITERREYRRKLEESNERLEQFAYAASHDLQEPLRMVSSYLQLLEKRYDDALDEDGEEFLAYAVDGAERMREMIDGLLAYSRIETRGDPLEPIDLETLVDGVLADLQVKIEETDAEITVDDLPCVSGDASQLRQVFQNLLDNALEYSGDDPPRVRVDAERDGDEWIVSVSDQGVGIDPDDQERIFEVFNRLYSHDEREGTGIGLALCERIVERHGGEIRVDSTPGEGSTFSVTLPAVEE